MKIKKYKFFLYITSFILLITFATLEAKEKSNKGWIEASFYINIFLGCFASLKLSGQTSNGQMGFQIAMGVNPIKIVLIKIIKNSFIVFILNFYSFFMSLIFNINEYQRHLTILLTMNVTTIFMSLLSFTLSSYLKTIYSPIILATLLIGVLVYSNASKDIFKWLGFGQSFFKRKYITNNLILSGSLVGLILIMIPSLRYYRYSRWNNIKPDIKKLLQNGI